MGSLSDEGEEPHGKRLCEGEISGETCIDIGDKIMGSVECTFFSLFFSVTSSFPALAAWRLSCLAVNWTGRNAASADHHSLLERETKCRLIDGSPLIERGSFRGRS